MPLLVESIAQKQTVNDLLREILINSLGILAGLTLRDFILSITSYMNPDVGREKIVFNLFIFMVCLFLTIVVCLSWT